MALKTKSQDIAVVIDPLSMIAGIEVVKGKLIQTLNKDVMPVQYEPDRRVLPLVLMPFASVADTDNLIEGRQPIVDVKWYEGSPKSDESNRIKADNPNYDISASGNPKNSLSVKKNIDPNSPMAIHAIFTIKDTRRNTEVVFEKSISLYTSLYDSKSLSLRLTDQPAGWVIDPLRVNPDSKGHWYYTISAQLYSGKDAVDDTHAAYWWQKLENGAWRDFTNDEKAIYVSGDNTKSLRFDARFIRKESFRCRAAQYNGTRPSALSNSALSVTNTVKVEFPQTLRAEIRQLAGAKIDVNLQTNVLFECLISDNKAIVPASKYDLFEITWIAKSGKAGSPTKVVGKGRTVSFTPSTLGFDKNYSMAVYAEVKMFAVRGLVTCNNKVVTLSGAAVTAVKFE